MAHAFDSELARPQRTIVRDAVIAGLDELRRASGGYLAAVEPLAVPLVFNDGEEAWHFIDVARGRSPIVAVALGARDYGPHGTGATQWRGELEVLVYIVSSAKRSHVARVAGDVASDASDQAEPGLEVIAAHVFERLAGRYFDESTGGILRPQRERLAYFGADYTVIEQTYQLELVTDVNPGRDLVQVLEDIRAAHTETTADPYELPAVTEIAP